MFSKPSVGGVENWEPNRVISLVAATRHEPVTDFRIYFITHSKPLSPEILNPWFVFVFLHASFQAKRESQTMSSALQIAANQTNAQLSTGPKTEAGKAKSSLNAVSGGLTGRTVLLPSEDAEAYREHMANYFVRHDPRTPEEEELVQDLAQTKWRLMRIPQLEEDLWALGAVLFASMFEDQPEDVRPGLIRAHTLVSYGKRFDNLFLQESRLTRRFSTLLKQLGELKLQRLAAESERAQTSVPKSSAHSNGFEFATPQRVRPEESFGALSPAEKAKVLAEVNQRFGKSR